MLIVPKDNDCIPSTDFKMPVNCSRRVLKQRNGRKDETTDVVWSLKREDKSTKKNDRLYYIVAFVEK